jgi:hypothetical protein
VKNYAVAGTTKIKDFMIMTPCSWEKYLMGHFCINHNPLPREKNRCFYFSTARAMNMREPRKKREPTDIIIIIIKTLAW